MLAISDNLAQCFSALRAHKLRASLTMLGLTMGVATLITVMTIVQGANVYVEQKIANLGTNVFQIARTPFAVTDFNIIIKALKYKKIEFDDMRAVAEGCPACEEVGATASGTVRARYGNNEVTDVNFYGQTASMADIDTRTVELGRYFTPSEAEHRANVCLIGDTLVQRLFLGVDPIGRMIRAGNDEFMVVGIMEKIGSVLGQDQDNFVIVPLPVFLRVQVAHTRLTSNGKSTRLNSSHGYISYAVFCLKKKTLSPDHDDASVTLRDSAFEAAALVLMQVASISRILDSAWTRHIETAQPMRETPDVVVIR